MESTLFLSHQICYSPIENTSRGSRWTCKRLMSSIISHYTTPHVIWDPTKNDYVHMHYLLSSFHPIQKEKNQKKYSKTQEFLAFYLLQIQLNCNLFDYMALLIDLIQTSQTIMPGKQANILFIGMQKSDYFQKKLNLSPIVINTSKAILQSISSVTICTQQTVTVDDKQLRLKIWNPSGQEQYTNLRQLAFHQVDLIVIAFFANQQKDRQMLQSFYQQIRKEEQRKKIQIILLPKFSTTSQQAFPSSDSPLQLISDDPYIETMENEDDLLLHIGRKYVKQIKIKKADAQKCCVCCIY